MKPLKQKISFIINVVSCIVFIPLILILGPTYYWLDSWPSFTLVITLFLYGIYFAVRLLNIPKLVVGRRYLLIAFIFLIFVVINYLIALYPLPEVTFNTPSLTSLYNRIRNYSMSMGVWLMSSIVMGYSLTISFIQELYRQMIIRRDMEYEKNKAELAVLKAQINPHFLFNTLNSLYGLIVGVSEKAEEAFVKFIELVKYTYSIADRETVAIGDEIAYIRNYIDLQSLRLNGHTVIKWKQEIDDRDVRIPPMILIIFVENAFKYGVSSRHDCVISISLTLNKGKLHFTVSNMIMKHADEFRSEMPVGIENCRARLNGLFLNDYLLSVEENGDRFNVDLKISLS